MRTIFILFISLSLFMVLPKSTAQESPPFRYFIGYSEPVAEWNSKDFNDSTWISGTGSIGYGDDDDSIVIESTTSLYLRYHLNALEYFPEEPDRTEGILLGVDYDDGFVAYLNGKELFRINMDQASNPPLHTQTTLRSHEAINYRWKDYGYRGFFIDSSFYKSHGLDTSSVLAFQVHNDSTSGSDLSFNLSIFFVHDTTGEGKENCKYKAHYLPDSSQLPIMVLETNEFGFGDPYEKNNIFPHMGIIDNGPEAWNKVGDPFNGYDGRIRGHVRGGASRGRPKLSYTIETQDSLGNNNNVSLLGLPEENDWVLYGSYIDKSLIRNELIFGLGRDMGHYTPRTRFCHLMLNGEYMGLYSLTEKIKRDKNRVDIAKLKPDEISGNDLTGGYIFSFESDFESYFEYKYPDPDRIAPEQFIYFKDYLDSCHRVLNSNQFRDSLTGYHKYYDLPSMIDFILITEMSHDFDAYVRSVYLYKNRDDIDPKIYSGPLWDFDLSMRPMYDFNNWQEWCFHQDNFIGIKRFLQDSAFVDELTERWYQLRSGILHTDSINQRIDQIIEPISNDINMNYKAWPTIHKPTITWSDSLGMSYEDVIIQLKNWLELHTDWMDQNMQYIQQPLVIHPEITMINTSVGTSIDIYPNPFLEEFNIRMELPSTQNLLVNLYDISGRLVFHRQLISSPGMQVFSLQPQIELTGGMYFLELWSNSQLIHKQKLLKINP